MRLAAFRARLHVEDAERADAETLAAIHGASFARGWSTEDFLGFLGERRIVCLVLRRIGLLGARRLAGFVLLSAVAGEAEVLTLAVEPACRGRGYGRRLMEEGARRLYRDRVDTLFLEVDETNSPALALYRSLGFETVGRRDSYYRDPGAAASAALVMRRQLR